MKTGATVILYLASLGCDLVVFECLDKILGRTLYRQSYLSLNNYCLALDASRPLDSYARQTNISHVLQRWSHRCASIIPHLCYRYCPMQLDRLVENQEPESYYPFPPPSTLAAPEVGSVLRSLGFGYRAEFIQRNCSHASHCPWPWCCA